MIAVILVGCQRLDSLASDHPRQRVAWQPQRCTVLEMVVPISSTAASRMRGRMRFSAAGCSALPRRPCHHILATLHLDACRRRLAEELRCGVAREGCAASVCGRGGGWRDGGIQSMQGLVRTVAVAHAARSSARGPPSACPLLRGHWRRPGLALAGVLASHFSRLPSLWSPLPGARARRWRCPLRALSQA
jgi:hypothetical protein